MAELIRFPGTFITPADRAKIAAARAAKKPTPGRVHHFRADVYLMDGELGFSVSYPGGKRINKHSMAAMLRMVAERLAPIDPV